MTDTPTTIGGVSGARGSKGAAAALLVAAIFVPQLVSGIYQGMGRDLPDAFPLLSTVALWLSVVAWFSLYSQEHRVPWVLDMGWFLFGAWVIVVPYYILKREGRAGLGRIALFCFTWLAAWAASWAVLIRTQVLVANE